MDKAVIFNIAHYCIHDGPGIRTTVFFKGCPLSCKWCHNPESLKKNPQQIFNPEKCIKCENCEAKIDIENCPAEARKNIGCEITITDLMKEINKDLLFYEQSKGGVTFSGGEPFYQADFLLEALNHCKNDYIHTVIDTCGFCESDTLLKAAEITNCFLYDLKFADPQKHKEYCGVDNKLIIENLKHLSQTKAKIIIRVPVIPEINDSLQEMTDIFNLIKDLANIETVHLLPYHSIHSNKYNKLGLKYELQGISSNKSPNIERIEKLFADKFETKIGG